MQISLGFPVDTMVKNLPTLQEMQVRFLGQGDPLEEEMAAYSSPVFLPGKSHGQRSLVGYSPWGHKRAGHNLATKDPLQKKARKKHVRVNEIKK